jgi:hypothetical protein
MDDADFELRVFSRADLPAGAPGRFSMLAELATPRPVVDADGEPTGEVSPPLIDQDTALGWLTGS